MRIHIKIYGEKNLDNSSLELFTMCTRLLSESTEIDITDHSPDIVHLFGCPENSLLTTADHFRKAEVPVVYSPLGTFLLTERKIKANFALIHTLGPKEAEIITRHATKTKIITFPSPILTPVTPEKFLSFLFETYKDVKQQYDDKIRENIERLVNTTIAHHIESLPDRVMSSYEDEKDILFRLLYIRHMLKRNTLPRELLTDLAMRLQLCDIDEPELGVLAKKLSCQKLLRRIVCCLASEELTTEGYYPATPLADKKAEQMIKIINEYNEV